MSYESKVIVADRCVCGNMVFAPEIATFDLMKMGYERVNGKLFWEIFTNPVDFGLYDLLDDGEDHDEEYYLRDLYGEQCKYTNVQTVIDWLKESEAVKVNRRAAFLLQSLIGMQTLECTFEQVVVVHFGY